VNRKREVVSLYRWVRCKGGIGPEKIKEKGAKLHVRGGKKKGAIPG